MESLRCFLSVLILSKSQFIAGITKDCDCTKAIKMVNSVRNVLLKDLFDTKMQNDMLSSRIDRLEQMFQEMFSKSVLSATQDKSHTEGEDSKSIDVDTAAKEVNEVPERDFSLENLIKAFQSEKKQRLQIESAVRDELKTLNDTFNYFSNHIDTAFTEHVKTMTNNFKNFEQNVADTFSNVEKEYKGAINDVKKLMSGVIETNLTVLEHELDSFFQDVSRLNMEMNSVIDIAFLNKTNLCEPKCKSGGVCFNDNTCRCTSFTAGTRCENFFCDDICAENGGTCIGPGSCKCPDDRDGVNCEFATTSTSTEPAVAYRTNYDYDYYYFTYNMN